MTGGSRTRPLLAADALLSRGWGRPIMPTVQTNTEKTFEQWLDELDGEGKRLTEEGMARLENGGLVGWRRTARPD
jgi:hypothetical protein